MQVYRGMDIGTSKASPAERARVPHHLIDVVDVTEPFDAAQFLQLAHRAVADIQARGRLPILCGGTGLYFKAFLGGPGPGAAGGCRVARDAASHPLARTAGANWPQRDPVTYERIDRQNPRRVIRAIEVIRLTGKPFSAQRADWQPSHPRPSTLDPLASASPALRRICNGESTPGLTPCSASGWVAETEQLLQRGLAQNQNAMQALGYRQIVEHLRGERSLAETIALVKIRTRQYAKKQMTWFRRQLHLHWIHLESQSSAEAIANTLAGL